MNKLGLTSRGKYLRALIAVGFVIVLFIIIYAPAFVLVGRHPHYAIAVPSIIVITFVLACVLILLLMRRWSGFQEYGFRLVEARYLSMAVLLAFPVATRRILQRDRKSVV